MFVLPAEKLILFDQNCQGCHRQRMYILGDVPKVGYFRDTPVEFKIKSLYSNDLILNIATKSKGTVQKLEFLDSPCKFAGKHAAA